MTKATAARGLHLQNTPPSDNPPTTPQKETTNVQNTRILSPVIQNDSTQTPATKAVKIKDKIGKISKRKVAGGKKKQQVMVEKKKNNRNRISRTKNKTICKKATSREEGKRTSQQKEEG
ncbi:hypothetical protein Tco_0244019 [Tanacetum coccineum]